MTDDIKTQICDALAVFIRQRPGLDVRNYGDRASYNAEVRGIARDKRDAEILLARVRGQTSLTADALVSASREAHSGRLEIVLPHAVSKDGLPGVSDRVRIEYCTGQYWPTEYRKAVAAVCAYAVWTWQREYAMPPPTIGPNGDRLYKGVPGGTWLRNNFRREFGSGLQKRWFD